MNLAVGSEPDVIKNKAEEKGGAIRSFPNGPRPGREGSSGIKKRKKVEKLYPVSSGGSEETTRTEGRDSSLSCPKLPAKREGEGNGRMRRERKKKKK